MISRSEASRLQQSSSRGANGDDTDTEISHSHFSWDILYTKLNTHEEVLTLSFSVPISTHTCPFILCTKLNAHKEVLTLSFSVPNSTHTKRYLPFHSLYQTQRTQRGTYPFILCTKLNAHKEVLTLSFSVPNSIHTNRCLPLASLLTHSFSVPNSTHTKGCLPFLSLCRTQHVKRYFIPIPSLLTHSFCVLNSYTQRGNYSFILCTKFKEAIIPIHSLCRTQHAKRYLYPFIHFDIIITLFSTYLFLFCTKLNTHKQVLTHSFSVPNATCEEALMPSHLLCQTQHTQRCTYPLILCTKLSTHD